MATGTTGDVIRAFLAPAGRPGDMRSHGSASMRLTYGADGNPDGGADLVSYATVVARLLPDGRLAVSPYSYSATTAKLLGQLLRERFGWSWSAVDGKRYVESRRRDWVSHSSAMARVNEHTPFVSVFAGGRSYGARGANGALPFPVIER